MVNEEQVASILVAIASLGGRVDGLSGRLDGMEHMREIARHDQQKWRDDIVDELREITRQTKATNGDVTELKLWRARVGGIASSFSWWQQALGAIIAVFVGYLLAQ